MAETYDDSSDEDSSYSTTNVLLGYASTEATDDTFSQLGGIPTWPEGVASSAELAKCKTCNKLMCLILQLNGDLPDRLPGHERRLYIFSCREAKCRRKAGSTRAVRGTKISKGSRGSKSKAQPATQALQNDTGRLGDAIFATKPTSGPSTANPFSSNAAPSAHNPFSTQSTASKADSETAHLRTRLGSDLAETFASKASISAHPSIKPVHEPWPESGLPKPYTSYHLDADYESLEPTPSSASSSRPTMDIDTEGGGDGSTDRELFESSMDKTFQQFADRLAQNPEQVLRYEFGGAPLFYSKTDALGSSLSTSTQVPNAKIQSQGARGIPNCSNCGRKRVFELQLVPQAIAELEADEMSLDGMDWGTVILGVCEADCGERGVEDGQWGWVEEWVGVQWEELKSNRKA